MINFLSGIGVIKRGVNNWKDNTLKNKALQEPQEPQGENTNSLDLKVENILLDSRKEEDLLFFHYNKNNLIKLEFLENNNNTSQFAFLEYDFDIEDDKIYLDEKEIEFIKTYHVLNVLRPKVEKYLSYKDIEFNCTFMSNIYSYAEEIGFENTVGYLLPLIQDLHYQKNKGINILMAFLDTFEKLLIYLRQYDSDHSIIIKKLLPIISQILLTKKDINLLNKAIKALKFLIDNITKDECLNNVIPILIQMGNNENNELGQTICLQIISDKAAFLGGEIIELYFLPMYESFTESKSESLRIYCLKYMIPLFEKMSNDVLQKKFVNLYKYFSKDKSFQIRKLSCNNLPMACKTILKNKNNYDIQKNIKKEELISNNLLPIFFAFTKDEERQIQNCALTIFGELLSYLDNDTIISNPQLLEYYTNRVDKLLTILRSKKYDTLIYKACYSFPSILLTYCKKINNEEERNKNWEKLKPIYMEFIKSKEFKIKSCIAASFGDISSILDEKIVETELSPLILEMYNNNGAKIKSAITSIIPKHLMYVKDADVKNEFLVIYKKGFNSVRNVKTWRQKLNYLKGIKKIGNYYDNYIIYKDLVGMLIELCFDPFNAVKKKSAKILSLFLLKFLLTENQNTENAENSSNGDKEFIDYKQNAIKILQNFATCKHYQYRQLFIYLCKRIIVNKKIFEEYVLELFYDLSYDKVSNIRFALAIFINMIWNKKKEEYQWVKNNEKIVEIIYRLKNDEDNEIRKFMEKIDINLDMINDREKVLEKKDVNIKFINEFKDFHEMFNYVPFLGKTWVKKK